MYKAAQAQKIMVEDSRAQEARTKTLDWISTVRYSQKQQSLQASRAKDTERRPYPESEAA